MYKTSLRSDLILLLAAVIWGFAFVAQRVGMDYVGPFTYNGVRFALGTLVLVPFLFLKSTKVESWIKVSNPSGRRKIIIGSLVTGLLLFGGVAFQQLGLQYTTAGKAGFITGLYVVFVPIVGLFFGQRSTITMWTGAVLSVVGLYLLSMTSGFTIAPGDKLVLYCAIIFTFHVLFIAWLSPLMNSFLLAFIQFAICALLNMVVAFAIEPVQLVSIMQGWLPIVYGGILSVGVAYTLQVIAQKTAHPSSASIILSLEAVFAVLGGTILLHEILTTRMLIGCALMLTGMIVVQVRSK
ncbi:MAG: DMT family transporter [Bacteroidales bacterium]|nr:DMT family transporter [Bacteroidales bacterium]